MADESIVFAVGDGGGTERLAQALQQLGITGEASINSITSALSRYAGITDATSKAAVAFNAAFRNGVSDVDGLRAAFDRFLASERQLENTNAAAAFQRFQQAAQAATGATQQAANAAQQAILPVSSLAANYQSGQQAVNAWRTAHAGSNSIMQSAVSVLGTVGNAVMQTATSVSSSTSAWGRLATAVTGYYTASKLIHDIDAVDSVTRQIEALVPAGEQADAVFNKLGETALATQTRLEVVSSSFSQVYGAIREGGGTAAQAATIVDNLSRVFYATGTTAGGAQRALHDFAEGLASGSLQGQQLNSALRQAPAAMAVLSQALDLNFQALTSHALATENARDRVAKLREEIQNGTPKLGEARDAVDKWQNKITEAQTKVDQLKTKLQDNTYSVAQHTAQQKELTRALADQASKSGDLNTKLHEAKAAYSDAQSSVDKNKASQLSHAEAVLKSKEALSGQTLQAKLSSAEFTAFTHGMQLGAGTISGAFQSLETSFQLYLKSSSDADTVTKLFAVTLGIIAQSLPILVPAVAGLTAAWVAYNVVAVIAAATTAILAGAYAPLIAGMLLLTGTVLALAGHYGLFDDIINKVYASVTVATAKTLGHTQAIGLQSKSVLDNTAQHNDNAAAITKVTAATDTATSTGTTAWSNLGAAIKNGITAALTETLAVINNWATTVASIVQRIIDGIKAAAAAVASALGGGGPGPAPAGARSGTDFTVAGSSGTDSKVISLAVSPGERVTVQTPGQQMNGDTNPNLPKFRNGGFLDVTSGGYNVNYANDNVGSAVGYGGPQSNLYTTSGGSVYSEDSIRAAIQAARDAAWKAAVDAANSAAAEAAARAKATADAASSATGGAIGGGAGGGGGSADNSSTTSGGKSFDSAGYNAAVQAWQKRVSDHIRNYTSVGGVAKPTDPSGNGWTIAQTNVYVTDGQRVTLSSDAAFYDADSASSVSGNAELNIEAKRDAGPYPNQQDYYRARNGANFMVGGASGVDTRLVQLAVSPGEQVEVKTPQQQRQANDNGGSTPGRSIVVNQTFTGGDVAASARSRRQMASDARRALGGR